MGNARKKGRSGKERRGEGKEGRRREGSEGERRREGAPMEMKPPNRNPKYATDHRSLVERRSWAVDLVHRVVFLYGPPTNCYVAYTVIRRQSVLICSASYAFYTVITRKIGFMYRLLVILPANASIGKILWEDLYGILSFCPPKHSGMPPTASNLIVTAEVRLSEL